MTKQTFRTATKEDFKIGVTLFSKNGNHEFVLRHATHDPEIIEAHTGKCIFLCEIGGYNVAE